MFAKRKIVLSWPDDDNPLSDYDKEEDFLIIGFCNSSVNYLFEIISLLIETPEAFLLEDLTKNLISY